LKNYKGEQDCCAGCRRKFPDGEIVMYEQRADLLFCQPDAGSVMNCIIRWVLKNGTMAATYSVRFSQKNEIIPGYGGQMTECSGCRKAFWHGEIFYIDLERPVAFCAAKIEDCVDLWRERIGQPSAVHQAAKRRFHGNT
jgi:hypothetical protein